MLRYTEITNKNFYFIVTAAEPSIPAMERTIDGFRGFLDCLEGAREKGIIYGTGVWKVGEIEGKPVLKEAYEIGETTEYAKYSRSCFKFIPRQIEPYVEADWSPRYAVNSGLLTKIKGFKMRDRGSIWPEHTCLQ